MMTTPGLRAPHLEPTSAAQRADAAQHSLTRHFGGIRPGSLRSASPPRLRHLADFNYWWLAHAVEVRVDAFDRSGCPGWLQLAEKTYAGIRRRNRGTLFNNYFDDMSWLALAALRLFDATGQRRYLDDASALFVYIVERGFSAEYGDSIAWRKSQLNYKNAPTNGGFGLVAARLFERTGSAVQGAFARSSLDFLDQRLFDTDTGLIADGINRAGDGRRDDDWVFTYNQGLYVGAHLAAHRVDGDAGHLDRAVQTALATVDVLAPAGVFAGENVEHTQRGGGDVGLFKGIFYRHLQTLLSDPAIVARPDLSVARQRLERFFVASTDELWATFAPSGLAADDWREFATGATALSTELSAVMSLEARARFEAAAS